MFRRLRHRWSFPHRLGHPSQSDWQASRTDPVRKWWFRSCWAPACR